MLLRALKRSFEAPGYWILLPWTFGGWLLSLILPVFDSNALAASLMLGFSLPAWYAIFGMLALHGHRILLHEARGLEDDPIPGATDVNPFTHTRPIGQAIIFLVCIIAALTIADGSGWLLFGLLTVALTLPWLGVNLEASLVDGMRPTTLMRLASGLKLDLVAHAALVFAGLGAMSAAIKFSSLLAFALSGMLFFSSQALIGRLLFHRRAELDLFTERSPEQVLEAALAEEERERDALFNELNRLCTTGRIQEAHGMLDEYIDGAYTTLDQKIHERLLLFHDKRLTLEHGVRYVQRLLERKDTKTAWHVFKRCLEHDDRFRPFDDEDFVKLTRGADRDDAALVAELLEDFDRAYPDSHLSANVKFRRARVLIELLGEDARGRRVLDEIEANHPEFAGQSVFREYAK